MDYYYLLLSALSQGGLRVVRASLCCVWVKYIELVFLGVAGVDVDTDTKKEGCCGEAICFSSGGLIYLFNEYISIMNS